MGWRIDYFLCNKEFMPYVCDSTIHNDFVGSDHCPIQLKIDLEREVPSNTTNEREDSETKESSEVKE